MPASNQVTKAGLLPSNSRKARYGVNFLGAICAQAGLDVPETNPDADHQAVDCLVSFPSNALRVQVKCTTKTFTKGDDPYLSWTVEDHWRSAWERNTFPVFFVAVRMTVTAMGSLFDHSDESETRQRAVGYWAMIDPKAVPTTVEVPKANLLTAESILTWEALALKEVGL